MNWVAYDVDTQNYAEVKDLKKNFASVLTGKCDTLTGLENHCVWLKTKKLQPKNIKQDLNERFVMMRVAYLPSYDEKYMIDRTALLVLTDLR